MAKRHESTDERSELLADLLPLQRLAGGKGCSYPRIRRWLARHGIKAVIAGWEHQRPDDKRVRSDKDAYKRRSVVERCFGWLRECRAVVIWSNRLAMNYLATVMMAMIQRNLRKLTLVDPPSDRA